MGSRILLAADIHLHPHRSDIRRAEDGLQCLNWIYETAKSNGVKTIIFAGDFFHHRFSINAYAASRAFGIVYSHNSTLSDVNEDGINTIFLLGNHDLYYEDKWSEHSLKAVREWATVIDRPTKMNVEGVDIDFLPYTPTPSKWINQPPFDNPARILISHLSIADAVLNAKYDILSVEDDTKEKEVIKAELLHKWEKVWLGHYHYGQKVSNQVEYIGSPMQLTFGEANQTKHVAIFDLETLQTQYIQNTLSPQFYSVTSEKELDKLNLKDSYVMLDFAVEQKFELRKKLTKLGVREVCFTSKTMEIKSDTSQALNNISILFGDKTKLIDTYTDNIKIPAGLNKDTLKKIGKEIVSVL